MSREEAIEILSEMRAEYNLFGDEEEATRYHVLSWAIQAMKDAQQWTPVSERPPEEGHDVLITKESFKIKGYEQKVIKAKRSADPRSGKIEWWSPEFGTLTNKSVLAWMPLPKPWKGEEDERT